MSTGTNEQRSGPAGVDADEQLRASPAAKRALAEAEARRRELDKRRDELANVPERGGRGGLDPVRYVDWEIGGRAVDF